MKTYNLGRVTNGFIILGYYNDLAALQAAISSPSIGDAYGVGVIAPYTIYVWNGSVWKDNGTLKGEKGDKGDPSTIPGPKGDTGPANSLSIGTVQSGTNAAATITGTAPTQTLNLTLPKGETGAASTVPGPPGNDGEDGRGIVSIIRTFGNGAAGTTDTYTVTYTDETASTFDVYNGADGSGSGDMSKSIYDPNNKVADAFNVDNHVNGTTNKVFTATEQSKLSGIDDNANNYTHPTTAGNKHIPAGGSSGQVLKYNADGEAKWDTDNDTIYTHPTTEGNKHIPSGGSAGKILKYKAAGEAEWANTPADDTKADKVALPTAGNFAGLDANGNLTDSGKKDADYEDAGAVSAHNSDSGAHSTQFGAKVNTSVVGAASGVASLDSDTRLNAAQVAIKDASVTSNTTLSTSHNNRRLLCSNSTAINLTIDTQASASYAADHETVIKSIGDGQVTIVLTSGVSVKAIDATKLKVVKGGSVVLKKNADDEWSLDGAVE